LQVTASAAARSRAALQQHADRRRQQLPAHIRCPHAPKGNCMAGPPVATRTPDGGARRWCWRSRRAPFSGTFSQCVNCLGCPRVPRCPSAVCQAVAPWLTAGPAPDRPPVRGLLGPGGPPAVLGRVWAARGEGVPFRARMVARLPGVVAGWRQLAGGVRRSRRMIRRSWVIRAVPAAAMTSAPAMAAMSSATASDRRR
jgi:hypothetical protein